MVTAMVDINRNDKAIVIVRLAIGKDMFAIAILARELADYEKLAHICEVINAKLLESNLWKQNYYNRISKSKIIRVKSLEGKLLESSLWKQNY